MSLTNDLGSLETQKIIQELKIRAVRSSGAGGQHVNKVSTKIELVFDIIKSSGLSNNEKGRITEKLAHRLTKENTLLLQCDETRSQHKNKDLAIKRLIDLLAQVLVVPKKRRKTKPSRSSIEKRLKSKKKAAQKKANRKKPPVD